MNVVVKETSKKGKGVFALKNFNKDEFILYIEGEVIETEHPSDYSDEIQNHWYPIDKKGKKYRYVLPQSPWMYLNHSCDSNAGIKNDRDIVAIRDIKKGEEIVFDYSTNNIDGWTMKCHCGSKNCRKIISTFDKLDKKSKEKLKDYLPSYIRKKYLG